MLILLSKLHIFLSLRKRKGHWTVNQFCTQKLKGAFVCGKTLGTLTDIDWKV